MAEEEYQTIENPVDAVIPEENRDFDDEVASIKAMFLEPTRNTDPKYDNLLSREMSQSNIPPNRMEAYVELIMEHLRAAELYRFMGGPYLENAAMHMTEIRALLKLWGSIGGFITSNILAPPIKYSIKQDKSLQRGPIDRLVGGPKQAERDHYQQGGD